MSDATRRTTEVAREAGAERAPGLQSATGGVR
jgi:hypothetical protein